MDPKEFRPIAMRVAQLSAHGAAVASAPERASAARAEYKAIGFCVIQDVLPGDDWRELAAGLAPYLERIAEHVVLPHGPRDDGSLSDGASFRRVDPRFVTSPAARAKLQQVFDVLGVTELAAGLAERLTPLIAWIAGPAQFERSYVYLYAEGDYISVHDDRHVGDRVDVQFPVSLGTRGGVRVLAGTLLRMHYDTSGAMNVLGPGVWHDVPPLLRMQDSVAPLRFNLGLRFRPPRSVEDGLLAD